MRRLQGAGALRLEVRGEQAPVVQAVEAVPGVLHVKAQTAPDGLLTLDVEPEAGVDVRADLASAIVTRGFGLLGLQQVGMSLEDIFLHLTTTDRAEEPSAAPASTEVSA
jgi:hypothetical protein